MDSSNFNFDIQSLFSSSDAIDAYRLFEDTVYNEIGIERLCDGVLLGLSGGADSVLLLLFINKLRKDRGLDFPVIACHVNHSIRKDEADRDEDFARRLCLYVGIEFISVKVDVPALSKASGKSLEEAARDARYSAFTDIISSRNEVSSIAVAHNSSDNAETVIFNIVRGASIKGACGIPLIRGNIIRPLLRISSASIRGILDSAGFPYVIDSTNLSSDYTRNYIRNEIMPRLSRISPSSVLSISRLTRSLSHDSDYLTLEADKIKAGLERPLKREELAELHPAMFARVFASLAKDAGASYLSFVHINDASMLIRSDNFSLYLPGEVIFSCRRGILSFEQSKDKPSVRENVYPISLGENPLHGTNGVFILSRSVIESSTNIYNFSIYARLSSAIIEGDLFVRFRHNGDFYRYGGMTHKLKKVFNDRNIAPDDRDLIPILCDSKGILWVPGLGVRDGEAEGGEEIHLCFATKDPSPCEVSLISARDNS